MFPFSILFSIFLYFFVSLSRSYGNQADSYWQILLCYEYKNIDPGRCKRDVINNFPVYRPTVTQSYTHTLCVCICTLLLYYETKIFILA